MWTHRLAWLVIATFVVGLFSPRLADAAPAKVDVPDELADWVAWVEEVEPEPRDCRKVEGEVTICVWPSYLELEVGADGASFALDVSVFGPVEVELPGDAEQWPQDVKVDGKISAVLREGEGPLVTLEEGRHTVTGFIPWREAPDSLRVPEPIGLINLTVRGTAVPFPTRSEETLSLEGARTDEDPEPEEEPEPETPEEPEPDSETMEVSRRLVDGVPLRVMTRIDVHVAGEPREVVLPNPTLEGAKLLRVSSPVPAAMGEGGTLALQVRRGTFSIELEAVLPRSPSSLRPPEHPAPWPDNEIWVWNAATAGAPSMGQVSLSGAQAIDHTRTHAPSEWQGGATYRLDSAGALQFEVIQRGVSETSTNNLTLRREMRVDLAGTGWTVVDDITGEMSKGNRMDLREPQAVLGSVATSGQPQVVTVSADGHSGVEVRGPGLDMQAIWRIEGATSSLPLGGWSEEFDSVELAFTLPRGWDLLYAEGPGSPEPTWIGAWRTLDLIVLLGVVLLVGRIVGLGAGGVAFVGLGLAYTRNGDGYLMLLALVAALAILLVPLRRPQSKTVELALRGVWGFVAFVVTAWVIWRVPAGVAAVWRDGLSGLAHVHLERELEKVAKLAMLLGVVGGAVLGVAILSARSGKGLGRVAAMSLVGVVGIGLAFMTLSRSADEGAPTSAVDFSEVGAEQDRLAAAPEPQRVSEEIPIGEDSKSIFLAKGEAFADEDKDDDEDVWGGLNGADVAEANGVGGLGLIGTGRGGGGSGEGTIGLGNTGLIGKGGGGGDGSGYGRGSGAGFGGRGKRVPRVRQGKAEVQGDLDKDIVRRIVRAHINEVRHCYEQGLTGNPQLEGRVSIEFSILGTGTVSSAVVNESTLPDAAVGNCITKSVKRWKFPKPEGGGAVTVTYPFVLSSGGGPGAASPVEERFVAKDVDLPEIEPPAVPQTGEGVPVWSGAQWTMTVNRTVKSDESVTLWLVSPTASRIVSVVRALALMLLAFLLLRAGWFVRPVSGSIASSTAARGASVGAAVLLFLVARPAVAAPPSDLLEQLAKRVNAERPLAPSPDCGTDCALVNKLEVTISGDELTLRAEVHMAGPGVWALPGPIETWMPRTVNVDGKRAGAMAVFEGQLLLHLEEGLHAVELAGPVGANALDLDLAGDPKHVVVSADGWTADGVDEDDLAQSLHFERDAAGDAPAPDPTDRETEASEDPDPVEPERSSRDIPPRFALQRHIKIGPRWTVETTVTRLNYGPSPTKLRVPLLPGESMLEATGKVDDPKATITLRAPGESIGWTSVLESRTTLELVAPEGGSWTESWTITCAGAWQCSDKGTPATADSGGTRVFHPWPGETLQLTFFEPGAADGELLAIDDANLVLDLGETGTDARLTMSVRTATVGERTITVPEGAHLGAVKMDGNDVPMAKDATELRLTFQPGVHEVEIEFQLDAGATSVVRAPVIGLGGRAVNARVSFNDSDASDRVVVWTSGEGVGPMVWLWPYFGVLALISILLARFTKPPLNALQWFLLSLGFSVLALPIVWSWFVLVQWREHHASRLEDPVRYNLAQIGLGLVTLVVVVVVVMTGIDLLSAPASTIVHNWSEGAQLSWYEDRAATSTPAAMVVTMPSSLWRAVWAAWVVWLGWSSIAWSKWAFGVVSAGGWLRRQPDAEDEDAAAETPAEESELE